MSLYYKRLMPFCEAMDKVITLPFHHRKTKEGNDLILELYNGFRRLSGRPLIFCCLEGLVEAQTEGRAVLLVTGASGKHFLPEVGETDGPLGTVVLARTIARGLCSLPVILTDSEQLDSTKALAKTIGLRVTEIEKAKKDQELSIFPNSVVVKSFPKDHDDARREAGALISALKPVAAIAIERSGFNSKRHYHTSHGIQVDWKAKMDYLFYKCQEERILTIGIGDGGNEIGMGKLSDFISKAHKYGLKCQCSCNSGVVSTTETDLTIVSTVANWGAYAFSNALAAHLQRRDLLHDRSLEEALLNAAIQAGFVDAKSGFGIPSVDGVSLEPNLSVVHLLKCLSEQAMSVE